MFPNKDCIDCPPCPPVILPVPIPDLSHVCGGEYNLSCIRYTGPNIPCLEIFSGTMMSEILPKFNAALAICNCCHIPDIDCVVSEWSDWSPCNCVPVGTGSECTQTRTRTIITPSSGDGAVCPVLSETRTLCCPVNCVSSYTYTQCDPATSTRVGTLVITTPASCGGTPCPAATIIENCIPIIDCVTSAWSDWSSCISGFERRTRTIITPASGGGQACGPLEETRSGCTPPPSCPPVSGVTSQIEVIGAVPTPTPTISTQKRIRIDFIPPVEPADSYTIYYSSNGGITYTHVAYAGSPMIIEFDNITECGKTFEGYIVVNCTNGLDSLQVPFPTITTPACPPAPACVNNYQPLIAGTHSVQPVTRRINVNGVFSQTDIGISFTTLSGGPILSSVLGQTGFYITGNFQSIDGIPSIGIGKLLCDHKRDPLFNVGLGFNANYSGDVQTNPGRGIVIAHDPTRNRIYVGGDFSKYNNVARNNFVVLNDLTGVIDTTINLGTGFQHEGVGKDCLSLYCFSDVRAIVVQPDGKILVAGTFRTYQGTPVNKIVRLNIDGSKDPTFNAKVFTANNTSNSIAINDMVLDTDGSIYVTGNFEKYDGVDSWVVVKLTNTGARDTTFNVGKNIYHLSPTSLGGGKGHKLLIQDNFIIIIGVFSNYGSIVTKALIRLNKTTGGLDTTYTKDTSTYTNFPNLLTIKKGPVGSNNILLGGNRSLGFQGDVLREFYYVLNATNLAIDVLDTPQGGPVNGGIYDIMIKYTP